MGYFITTKSKQTGQNLFLINRELHQEKWWTLSLDDAIHFRDKDAADRVCKKYRFNDPRVVTLREAVELEQENIRVTESEISQ